MDKLFFIVFKNKVLLNLILSNVHHIHRDILKESVVKWNKLSNNLNSLSYHNYLKEIKQYHNNRINKDLFNNNINLIIYITRGDSLDVLQYIIDQQPHLLTFNILNYYSNQKRNVRADLLYYSVKYNSLKIFNYLESFTTNKKNNNKNNKRKPIHSTIISSSSSLAITNKIEWDYYHAISIVPYSGNIKLFLYLFDKVDIRKTILKKTNNNDEYKNIIEFIINSAEYGRSEMLNHIFSLFKSDKHLLDDILIDHSQTIFESIIRNGHLILSNNLLSQCAKYNQFEMMKYIHENKLGSIYCTKLIDYAVYNGNVEMVKWLHENRTERCTPNTMNCAASKGHLEIIKWLHYNRSEGCTTYAMDYAAEFGHFETLKWLHANRSEGCTAYAMDRAAWYGHLEIIKWLHENRTEGCTTSTMNLVVYNGNLEIVKWLHHNRTEGCTTHAMNSASEYGHLEIVKWLHENRTEGCTTYAMDNAAKKGNLEIIKWLHHNRTEGCTTWAMDNAAMNGHLETIKWLHQNRTEGYTTKAIAKANTNGHLEVINWLNHIQTDLQPSQ